MLAPGLLHQRIVYTMGFEVAGTAYEIRARTGSTVETPAGTETDDPHFGLYRCDPECAEETTLRGGIGTTGVEVVISVPLAALGAPEGEDLTGIRVSTSREQRPTEPGESLDEMELPDAAIPTAGVLLGTAPADIPEDEVAFETESELSEGMFSRNLETSALPSGEYRVWARACLGEICGARSVVLTP